MRSLVVVLAVLAGWSSAAPTNDVIPPAQQAVGVADAAEQDLLNLSAGAKQTARSQQVAGEGTSKEAEFGFDPRTLELIEAIVQQAEDVAEREFAAELMEGVMLRRNELEEQQEQENQIPARSSRAKAPGTATIAPPAGPATTKFLEDLADVPEGKAQQDAKGKVKAESVPVKMQISERIKSIMSHLPYPLTSRDLQPRTRRR